MKSILRNVASIILFLIVFLLLIKVSGWSPLNLIFGPQYEKEKDPSNAISVSKVSPSPETYWWLSEYSILLKTIEQSPTKEIKTSYKTGPDGMSKVVLTLYKKGPSLLLQIELPKQALVAKDNKTGKMIPSEIKSMLTIRDNNSDGKPNDFVIEPGHPLPNAIMTSDGFIKIQDTEDFKGIFIQWAIGIGFSVNHFLHGIDSAYPRK